MQDGSNPKQWSAQFVARNDGEVFIYVNDTSIFAPWLLTLLYDNNHGSAAITMRRINSDVP